MSHSTSTLKNCFAICLYFFLTVTCPSLNGLFAQSQELPLHADLKQSSEKMKVSMGAKIMNSTFKIKVGTYTMDRTKIIKEYTGENKFLGLPLDNHFDYSFSTQLSSKAKDSTYMDVAKNIDREEIRAILTYRNLVADDYELTDDYYGASVFLRTNLNKNDHWLLLLSTSGEYEFSANTTRLTNGKDHVTVKAIETDPFGSIMKSPALGMEFYLNDTVLAALQYQSGGGFGHKKIVWLSKTVTAQQKLIILASCASILELLGDTQ